MTWQKKPHQTTTIKYYSYCKKRKKNREGIRDTNKYDFFWLTFNSLSVCLDEWASRRNTQAKSESWGVFVLIRRKIEETRRRHCAKGGVRNVYAFTNVFRLFFFSALFIHTYVCTQSLCICLINLFYLVLWILFFLSFLFCCFRFLLWLFASHESLASASQLYTMLFCFFFGAMQKVQQQQQQWRAKQNNNNENTEITQNRKRNSWRCCSLNVKIVWV